LLNKFNQTLIDNLFIKQQMTSSKQAIWVVQTRRETTSPGANDSPSTSNIFFLKLIKWMLICRGSKWFENY